VLSSWGKVVDSKDLIYVRTVDLSGNLKVVSSMMLKTSGRKAISAVQKVTGMRTTIQHPKPPNPSSWYVE
jgi:hypothetical protein